MTNEEAIKELIFDKALYESSIVWAGDGTPDGNLILALDMAIEALEKQIPKRVKTDEAFGNCPVCGYVLTSELINEYGIKYCPECGQALDWSAHNG